MSQDKRRQIRIKYPRHDRPRVRFGSRECPVLDLSASGMKFRSLVRIKKGTRLELDVIFGDRRRLAGGCTVVRTLGDLIMVHFDTNIEQEFLRKEADYLLDRYGSIAI